MCQPVILLISGNQTQTALLHCLIQEAAYRVFDANCGACVPEMLVQAQPRLVLLDWNLPDMNALDVVRMIRKKQGFNRLPIILICKGISYEDQILCLDAGADFCIDGVAHPREILARMRALLRRVNPNGR